MAKKRKRRPFQTIYVVSMYYDYEGRGEAEEAYFNKKTANKVVDAGPKRGSARLVVDACPIYGKPRPIRNTQKDCRHTAKLRS